MASTPAVSASVLVRAWFGDDGAWESLVLEVRAPSEDGFLARVVVVDDPVFEGLSASGLRGRQSGGAAVSFLADEVTFASAEHPVLAVWVLPGAERESFRVVPAVLWSVENNINLGNLGWEDFVGFVAGSPFRGF